MILVNGESSGPLDARDRGLAYGDGVFRTLRLEAGQPVWWADHYARLAADCAALELVCPDEARLRGEIGRVAADGAEVVKIIVTRGAGARGYAPPAQPTVTRIVLGAPLPAHAGADAPVDVRARWCDLRLARQPRLAGIKHLNRLEQVLARAEWDDPGIFEGLLCDDSGAVISGVMSNLFLAKDGELRTPDLAACGVAGVARARLLDAAARAGLTLQVCRLTPDAILDADEVMLCNSLIGVRRVAALGEHTWVPAGWTSRLNRLLYDLD
ncbi:MAG: aminodeoxychorismate lyase [Pseudomonadota bacterium]